MGRLWASSLAARAAEGTRVGEGGRRWVPCGGLWLVEGLMERTSWSCGFRGWVQMFCLGDNAFWGGAAQEQGRQRAANARWASGGQGKGCVSGRCQPGGGREGSRAG
jgi:hypothetical protein